LNRHPVFNGIEENSSFYFVHSYYPAPLKIDDEIGRTEYGFEFSSAVAENNVIATQFHPEKSGETGLRLLSNFLNWEI
jgi:glutamine amidotransferase